MSGIWKYNFYGMIIFAVFADRHSNFDCYSPHIFRVFSLKNMALEDRAKMKNYTH